jgi:chorismate dehydratase
MPLLRIVSTSYLNALPLTWGFTYGPFAGMYDLGFHPPAVCADRLRDGLTDVALIPSIEFQRIPGLCVIPGIGIGSKGRVGSVILVSRVRFEAITSVAVDSESRTAVSLLHILLRQRGFHPPRFTPMQADLQRMLQNHDAALIIGDRALKTETGSHHVFDLAWEWRIHTGLPFVFAFWAVRPGSRWIVDHRPFVASRRLGLAAIDEIAHRYAPGAGLETARMEKYLRVNIHYHLGSPELQSLELFYRLAGQYGLIPSQRPVRTLREEGEGIAEAVITQ